MQRNIGWFCALISALALAACGPHGGEQSTTTATSAAAAPEPTDPTPRYMGAVSSKGEGVADQVNDGARVRDITFAADGNGTNVEVVIDAPEGAAVVELFNNEGVKVAETHVGPGQAGRLVGKATGGRNNLIRFLRDALSSGPTPIRLHVRAVAE